MAGERIVKMLALLKKPAFTACTSIQPEWLLPGAKLLANKLQLQRING